MWNNPLRQSYNRDLITHLNEVFDQVCHRDAPVVPPPPFSVLEYIKRCSTYFKGGRFRQMQIFGNELQVRDRVDDHLDMPVAG